jgi:serine O-acetyltransferase
MNLCERKHYLESPILRADRIGPPEQNADLLDMLCTPNDGENAALPCCALPTRASLAELVEDVKCIWYPSHFSGSAAPGTSCRERIAASLDRVQARLRDQVRRAFGSTCADRTSRHKAVCGPCNGLAEDVTAQVIARLPTLRALLDDDIQAAFEGDPAARWLEEVLCCYPGVNALLHHRIAHELFQLEVPLLPRIIAELARASTGIDIHPGASIGPGFFIDHGAGVVIGETARIGSRVRIYQGVTLGARSFPRDGQGRLLKGIPRHPIVEDDVVIYARATILGRVTIGCGATIAGNVWVTRSVPAGSVITKPRLRTERFEGGAGI